MLLGLLLLLSANPVDEILRVDKPVVPDAVFARRVYLDVWGMLPSPDELAQFETDPQPDKRTRLIDRLLADSRRYADHWMSFWNDHLRNDEGVVYHGERKSISAWLRQALVENLPYDKFVQALLNPAAGNGPEGFLIGVNWRGDVSASELPPMQAAQNSSQVFLGVNLKCNSCHDSFISKWKLKDAYGMAALFSRAELEIFRCDVPTGEKAQPKFLFPDIGSVPEGLNDAQRRTLAADLFTSPKNTRLARTLVNRFWKRLIGRGLVEPVDEMDGKGWNPELLEALAGDFASGGYDMKRLLRTILYSRAYQLPAVPPQRPYRFEGPYLRRLSAEQFVDAVAAITGEWRVRETGTGGDLTREFAVKSTPLSRALGRPIRDQVVTVRQEEATTLQALEIVNGATLSGMLHRGALRMLGRLPAPPPNTFDSGVVTSKRRSVEVDITGARKLWLLAEDSDSYDRSRVTAGWFGLEFSGSDGATPPEDRVGPIPSTHVLDLAGKGYTRLRASVGVDPNSVASDINPRVRFFVFREEPDRSRLVNLRDDPPASTDWSGLAPDRFVERLYRAALARVPSPRELEVAAGILGRSAPPQPDALEDLLWSVFLSPEFQYIR
jgi:hypothetical protein